MRYVILLLTFALLAGPAVAEMRLVETPAGPGSLAPELTALADGGAVLTWLQPDEGGHVFRFSVFDGERFGPAATIAAGEDWFANWADRPGLFELPNGDWVAHWLVKSAPATFAYDVVMARSTDRGMSWSETLTPHSDGTPTEHGFVSYFAAGDESAGVVWLDGRETAGADEDNGSGHHNGHAGNMTLRTAVVGPGNAVADNTLLDARVCDCCPTASAMTADGPVVVYRGRTEDEIRDIRVVRRVAGQWTEPAEVHRDGWQIGGCPVNGPDVIADGREVIAAWFTMPGGTPQVRLARSTDAGQSFAEPVVVDRGNALGRVALAWAGPGFVLAWMSESDNGAALMLSGWSRAGEALWRKELVSMDGGRVSGFPRLAVLGDTRLLAVWTSPGEGRRPAVRVGMVDLPYARVQDEPL